ncbi:MAG: OmpA family protein [Ferruginibacter sp.]
MKKILFLLIAVISVFNAQAQKPGSLEESPTTEETGFVAGTRIIFSDNFSKDAVGDFPAKWNSTKSGEVKKLKSFENNFLKISDGSVVYPQLTKPLPEHFTVQFDLIVPGDVPLRMASFAFGTKPLSIHYLLRPAESVVFSFHTNDKNYSPGIKFGTRFGGNTEPGLGTVKYSTPLNTIIKCAIAVNKTRIRLFVDGKKMVDLPTAFNPQFRKSLFFCPSTHGSVDSKLNYFYISNLVIAEAGVDKRSQVIKDLMEKGNTSTTAIQFATNSDVITTNSNEVIQQFADALKENAGLNLKIIGHTDSDGDDAKNLLLSKKRANAVKLKLVSMGIKNTRLSTDGKGETQPVADNKTEAGKAENRRVEFVKM